MKLMMKLSKVILKIMRIYIFSFYFLIKLTKKRKINRTNKFSNGENAILTTKKSTSTEKQFEFNKNNSKQNGFFFT